MISADAAATHQAVIRVMEASRLAGLSQITFTTQSSEVSAASGTAAAPSPGCCGRSACCSVLLVSASEGFSTSCAFSKAGHPGIPVIVVGNLTVGGSGKTPLVIWIAEFLKAKGWSPGIVSRGYGGKRERSAPRAATIASEAAEVGDEPVLLSRRSGCPVWVGADRAAGHRPRCARRNPDVNVLILDDGLQHYRAAARPRDRGGRRARLRQRLSAAGRAAARAGVAAAHRRRGGGERRCRKEDFTMLLDGDDAAPHDRRARAPAAARRSPGRRCTRSPASATRSASSCSSAQAGHQGACRTRSPTTIAFTPRDLEFGDDAAGADDREGRGKIAPAPRGPNWWVLPVTRAARLRRSATWLLRKLR